MFYNIHLVSSYSFMCSSYITLFLYVHKYSDGCDAVFVYKGGSWTNSPYSKTHFISSLSLRYIFCPFFFILCTLDKRSLVHLPNFGFICSCKNVLLPCLTRKSYIYIYIYIKLEMIVGVLTTCRTQFTWDRSICIFFI